MSEMIINNKCSRCSGSGIDNNVDPSISCPACLGTGIMQSGVIDSTEIMDLLDWIKKHIKKIEKKLDIPEE